MREIWLPIKTHAGYEVSNFGSVRSVKTGLLIRSTLNSEGYVRVNLKEPYGFSHHYVHQLVAHAFFSNFVPGTKISFVNGDKTDCSIINLTLRRYVISRESRRYGRERTKPWGNKVRIQETGEVFRTARQCASHIGGEYSAIYACLRGERRTHLGYTFAYHDDEDE